MTDLQHNIVQEVKENGIAFSSVKDLFNENQLGLFNKGIEFFNGFMKAPHIIERCNRIAQGNPIQDRSKWFEITQYEYLKSGIGLDNPIVQMYMQDVFIDMATEFHGVLPKVRNILTWIHPQNPIQQERNSQVWHRDQEDWEIFKVFVLFSNVEPNNGPTQYVKKTQHGGKYDKITNNMNGQSTSVFTFPVPEEEIVSSEGPAGTIVFMNTNGLHKGGLIKEGVRVMTQANFLKPSAPLIENGVLGSYEYNDKINIIDRESQEFQAYSDKIKSVLS